MQSTMIPRPSLITCVLVFLWTAWPTRASTTGGTMKNLVLAGVLALVAASTAHASQFRQGDWVLAQYRGSSYWFPGVVESARGDSVTIAYDDGERETRPDNQVKPYSWRVGSSIECRWQGGSEWYAGRITRTSEDGETISVAYEDGDKEQTKTRKCRSR